MAATALALTAVLGTVAHAQTAQFNTGDLLLGFEQAGAASDYEVDLGAFTQFSSALTQPLTFQLSTADLSATFGSTWASNSQSSLVQWGVIGSGSSHGNTTVNGVTLQKGTLFYTQGEQVPGTQSTAPGENSSGTNSTIITALGNATQNGYFDGVTTTGNGSLQAVVQSSNGTYSWQSEIANNSFASGLQIQQPLTGTGTGPTDSILDLYQSNPVNGGTAAFLGELTLDSSGVLTFDSASVVAAAAVPEPSTLALMALGTAAVLWNLRRKSASVL